MGGQDASIVIVKSMAGRCTAMSKAVNFHGRVIGNVIVKLNSIIKIIKITKTVFLRWQRVVWGSRSQDLLGEWRLKTRTLSPPEIYLEGT